MDFPSKKEMNTNSPSYIVFSLSHAEAFLIRSQLNGNLLLFSSRPALKHLFLRLEEVKMPFLQVFFGSNKINTRLRRAKKSTPEYTQCNEKVRPD
jgi:hypothetical protein